MVAIMKVGDLMTRHVEFLPGNASARDAAELMGELDVGALPVGTPEEVLGVVTDRDILYRVVAEGLASDVPARDVASRPVIGCGADDTLQAAMDLMATHHIRRLAIRDVEGRVVGWITLSDLARHLLVEHGPVQEALRSLTEASDQAR
jgi:CBS domain-containing protein